MGENEIKDILLQYRELVFERDILENQCQLDENSHDAKERLKKVNIMLETIKSCISSLDKNEAFVVQHHILEQLKWEEVVELYITKYGMENSKSERTLKRLQAQAIEKISKLINVTETTTYLRRQFR